jgi:valyl-tRNA synthetase
MEDYYNHKDVEKEVISIWDKNNIFIPKINYNKKPFSIFLTPPNASGGIHIGNALMIAVQDIMARRNRINGIPTLYVPGTDHGGYETQITFEKELKKEGKDKVSYTNQELFEIIKKFVENNNNIIKKEIKSLGCSVDWSKFRFTMDAESIKSVFNTFSKMISDNLIYRRPYMVNYCPLCATILADIELKESTQNNPLYFIKFFLKDSNEYISLATTMPEFLFSVSHVLIHPNDERYAKYIGKTLINPITKNTVEIIESKRKFDPDQAANPLSPFLPSCKKYDYEYTLKNKLPAHNLLDWEGKMIERYPNIKPEEARKKESDFLKKNNLIEKIDESFIDSVFFCKNGHKIENIIMLTWFLNIDDPKISLRKNALAAIEKENLNVIPGWRKKGLIQWIEKMSDWPIARQNVWGIKIPIWYDVSDPSKFTVWFIDKNKKRHNGNLKEFLDNKISLQEIEAGLEKIYASESASWTFKKENNKTYLPETDTFDTWFSSGQWGTIVFENLSQKDFTYFYPSDSIVIGYDLLRLSVTRKILLSQYLNNKLPFKNVYLHRLIKGLDGQKMSKSLGNSVSLEYYLEKFGADVTRMALTSYVISQEDFSFSEDKLEYFKKFTDKLWEIGLLADLANQHKIKKFIFENLSLEDKAILAAVDKLNQSVDSLIAKFLFTYAQDKICDFLSYIEEYTQNIKNLKDPIKIKQSLSVLQFAYKKYLIITHPFVPFLTEKIYQDLYRPQIPLAGTEWPKTYK